MKTFREYINEDRKPKLGAIETDRRIYVGTIQELIQTLSYTLEVGHSYEHEKGNKKVNLKPKTFKALVKALENSLHNSGNRGFYSLIDMKDEWYDDYEPGDTLSVSK